VPMYAVVLLGRGLGDDGGLPFRPATGPHEDRGGPCLDDPEEVQAAMAAKRTGQQPQGRRGPEVAPEAKTALNMAIAGAIVPVVGLGLGPFRRLEGPSSPQS